MRTKQVMVGAAGVLVALIGGGLAVTELRSKRTFDVPYPAIPFPADAVTIERGRYLVYGPAACAYCHVPREQWTTLGEGTELPLTGNHIYRYLRTLPPTRHDTGPGMRDR